MRPSPSPSLRREWSTLCVSLTLPLLAVSANAQGSWGSPIPHGNHMPGCPHALDPTTPHRFIPVHASVIPTGHYRGKVLVWDKSLEGDCSYSSGERDQRWAILDPTANPPTVEHFNWRIQFPPNQVLPPCGIPGHQGLFCAGHAWLPDGRLMFAGGDYWALWTCGTTAAFAGSVMVGFFTPPTVPLAPGTHVGNTGPWQLDANRSLRFPRWYPSIVVTGAPNQGSFVYIDVQGGIKYFDPAQILQGLPPAPVAGDESYNTHEVYVFDLQTNQVTKDTRTGQAYPQDQGVFRMTPPPAAPILSALSFYYYPHSHFMPSLPGFPSGLLWTGGMPVETASFDITTNPPEAWLPPFPAMAHAPPPTSQLFLLEEGTTVLLPNLTTAERSILAVFGGMKTDALHNGSAITNEAFMLDTAQPNPTWQALEPMHHARKFANSVILPDSSILIVGGGQSPGHSTGNGVREPELYREGMWTLCAPEASDRTYHSCAVLLPDGRVLSCGGDSCTPGIEYQIFSPDYLNGARPGIVALSQSALTYNVPFTVDVSLAVGQTLDKVVLMKPGSVTHGHDPNQRWFQMTIQNQVQIQGPPQRIVRATVLPPQGRAEVPPGHYMMFAVTTLGTPSVATWVSL